MKDLRPAGTSIRILFIFDPSGKAILLLGGDKAGSWKGWYDNSIPVAGVRYQNRLVGQSYVAALCGRLRIMAAW